MGSIRRWDDRDSDVLHSEFLRLYGPCFPGRKPARRLHILAASSVFREIRHSARSRHGDGPAMVFLRRNTGCVAAVCMQEASGGQDGGPAWTDEDLAARMGVGSRLPGVVSTIRGLLEAVSSPPGTPPPEKQ